MISMTLSRGRFTPEQRAELERRRAEQAAWLEKARPTKYNAVGAQVRTTYQPTSAKVEGADEYSARMMRIEAERFNNAVRGGCCGG
jgi:hypothetical protein